MVRYFSRVLIWVVMVAALVALLLGFGGALHPAFDSLAIGRIGFGLTVAVLAPVVLGMRGWIAAVLLLTSLLPLVPLDRGEDGPILIYSKNIYFRNADAAPIVADILAVGPDIVVLQEVSARQTAVLASLVQAYPHQYVCRTARWNGIVIASRFEIVTGSAACAAQRSAARVQVMGPDGPFWVVGVHNEWPWPKRQQAMVSAALPMLEDMTGDVIVAGDFNTVPWSAVSQSIGQATGTALIGPRRPTFWLGWVPLPLDQVWGSCGGRVERRPKLTSDHYGVLARVFAGNC